MENPRFTWLYQHSAKCDEVIGHHKDGAVFDSMEGLVGSDV